MLIFPVQSIAYFHVVLVVRHSLKYLFLMVLNYRVIDAYIFLRYLVNKCTHIMHNLQQHMLRVLLFFTVKFYWSTTLSRKPFLFFDCVDYSLFKKESTQAMNLYLNTQNSISCTDLVNSVQYLFYKNHYMTQTVITFKIYFKIRCYSRQNNNLSTMSAHLWNSWCSSLISQFN